MSVLMLNSQSFFGGACNLKNTNCMGPGLTALTVMPSTAANSLFQLRTKLSSAAFEAKNDFRVSL